MTSWRPRSSERDSGWSRRYAPLALVLLAGTWAILVIVGFTPLHWAMGDLDWMLALQVSGSWMEVNDDQSMLELCAMVEPPSARRSSDRVSPAPRRVVAMTLQLRRSTQS